MSRQENTNEQENKKAVSAAMQLLLCRQRTEKELRHRLQEKGFSEEAEEEAIAYVRSFGYLNDRNYDVQTGRPPAAFIPLELYDTIF